MLFLGWSHRYKFSTVVFVNWLTITKYIFLNSNGYFSLMHRFFFPLSPTRLSVELTIRRVYISSKKQVLFIFRLQLCTYSGFWCGPFSVLSFFCFVFLLRVSCLPNVTCIFFRFVILDCAFCFSKALLYMYLVLSWKSNICLPSNRFKCLGC